MDSIQQADNFFLRAPAFAKAISQAEWTAAATHARRDPREGRYGAWFGGVFSLNHLVAIPTLEEYLSEYFWLVVWNMTYNYMFPYI